jgi:hypothetical protein
MFWLYVGHLHLLYSMEQSPCLGSNQFAASQEISRILCDLKVHYRIHKCPPFVSILSHLNPVRDPTPHFLNIHLSIVFPSTPGLPQLFLSRGVSHQNPVHISPFPTGASCHITVILLDFISCTLVSENYRSLTYSI